MMNLQQIKNQLKPMPSRLRWYIHRPVSLALIATGLLFLITRGYWFPIKIGIPVYPMSLIIIGALIFALDYRFGDLTIPIAIFLIFSYDLLIRIGENELNLLLTISPSFVFQIAMVIGGYFLARKPQVRFSKYFLPFVAIYLLFAMTRYYHLIEASYYATMLFAIRYPVQSLDSIKK